MPKSTARELDDLLIAVEGDVKAMLHWLLEQKAITEPFYRSAQVDLEDAKTNLWRARNILRQWALDSLNAPRTSDG